MVGVVLFQGVGDLPLEALWGTAIGFVIIMVVAVGAIGLAGRNLAVASSGAYLTFAFYAVNSGIGFLETLMYITLTLVIVGFGFKLWRMEGFETGT